MIRPIGMPMSQKNTAFKADKDRINKQGEYVDPLMNWPMRGAAFTNEVGEALRPMIGNMANLTWVPALMYIGADVYDKYKNDQNEYSPNSRRCLKQAIFQGLASVFLPVYAVKAGQDSFSLLGRLNKDKISINAKEHISKIAEQFIANGKIKSSADNEDKCIEEFITQVSDSLEYRNKKKSIRNSFKIFNINKKENIENYSRKTITDLINLRKELLNNSDNSKNKEWLSIFHKEMANGVEKKTAIKTTLTNFQRGKLLKGKMLKTIGGFCALGIAIKPIDNFVENVLIGKYVGPKIDNIHIKHKNIAQ